MSSFALKSNRFRFDIHRDSRARTNRSAHASRSRKRQILQPVCTRRITVKPHLGARIVLLIVIHRAFHCPVIVIHVLDARLHFVYVVVLQHIAVDRRFPNTVCVNADLRRLAPHNKRLLYHVEPAALAPHAVRVCRVHNCRFPCRVGAGIRQRKRVTARGCPRRFRRFVNKRVFPFNCQRELVSVPTCAAAHVQHVDVKFSAPPVRTVSVYCVFQIGRIEQPGFVVLVANPARDHAHRLIVRVAVKQSRHVLRLAVCVSNI